MQDEELESDEEREAEDIEVRSNISCNLVIYVFYRKRLSLPIYKLPFDFAFFGYAWRI